MKMSVSSSLNQLSAMEAFKASSFHRSVILTTNPTHKLKNPIKKIPFPQQITTPSPPKIHRSKHDFKVFTAASPISPSTEYSVPPEEEIELEKFDWYSQWYPVALVCDLDKRRPHGKEVLGIDLVVWWDRNENAWKVFDDSCPHRLAPLSEGRIDQWGRLQCVYHGWCFGGAGDCKFIPQAPRDGPPIHTSNKACVATYPSCEQNGIVWFWPNSDPKYKDIFSKKKPHYFPELDDPSYTNTMISRDISYGYEILIENLMDPAHVPYSHHGILDVAKALERADREGGRPHEINISKFDQNGFSVKQVVGENYFVPPCIYYNYTVGLQTDDGTRNEASLIPPIPPNKNFFLIYYCVPVSPGKSRFFFAAPRNFAVWVDRIVPRWISHISLNLIIDSDLNLLHVEECKLKEMGPLNWHKACFVPTKADALVVAFRRWFNKYSGAQVDWKNKYSGELPPTPPREQLLDRYWTHTVQCSSCNAAYKGLNALEIALQVISVSSIAFVAAAKQGLISVAARYFLVSMAVLCFVASKWLSHFIYKTFRFHDYDHAFR